MRLVCHELLESITTKWQKKMLQEKLTQDRIEPTEKTFTIQTRYFWATPAGTVSMVTDSKQWLSFE